jgi:hypothetical protein
MTDQELKDLVAGLAMAQAKTEIQLEKTHAEVQETSRVLKEVGRRMGSMASNQGDVAEEFFYNSLKASPQVGGIVFDTVTPNLIIGTRKSSHEFDIVLVNGQNVALVEVKYKAHINDLDQIKNQVDRYRELRPEHQNYKIFGGIAGFNVPADVIKSAQERGMFVLQRKGEVIDSATDGMRAF